MLEEKCDEIAETTQQYKEALDKWTKKYYLYVKLRTTIDKEIEESEELPWEDTDT